MSRLIVDTERAEKYLGREATFVATNSLINQKELNTNAASFCNKLGTRGQFAPENSFIKEKRYAKLLYNGAYSALNYDCGVVFWNSASLALSLPMV